jgi:hypothetical protein
VFISVHPWFQVIASAPPRTTYQVVIAGLDPAIHAKFAPCPHFHGIPWIAGSSPAMTVRCGRLLAHADYLPITARAAAAILSALGI